MTASLAIIDRDRLSALIDRERAAYRASFPASRQAFAAAGPHLLGGVPMTWMRMWPGGFPLYCATAAGARLTDIDGHEFIDFCLGDTGAMAGHSPAAVQAAVSRRYGELGGATTMLPTQDAAWVAAELTRRFGVGPLELHADRPPTPTAGRSGWPASSPGGRRSPCSATATTAASTRRSSSRRQAGPRPRAGNVGAPVDPRETTRVVEFNDLAALDRELAHGDVAAVLMEPALTNIGIVLPEAGYLDAVRELTRQHGTLLINDETHTFSAGPGRLHRRVGPGTGHGDDRQGDRRRHPGRCLRPDLRAGRADPGRSGGGHRGHRRRRRHARRQRAVRRRHAGHPRRGADRRGLRRHDRGGHPVHRRRAVRPGQPPPAVDHRAARRARRVPVLPRAAATGRPVRKPPPTPNSTSTCTCT